VEDGLRRVVENVGISGVSIEEDDLEDVMRQAYQAHLDVADPGAPR
jgi:hypothetical protein